MDGTYIPAFLPIRNQKRFWLRKSQVLQNIFAAVSFEGLFLYVLARAEGSMNDSSLLRQALTRLFMIPLSRFYLADAGFGVRRGILILFSLERYYLNDWADEGRGLEIDRELFNLRYASIRTIVE